MTHLSEIIVTDLLSQLTAAPPEKKNTKSLKLGI